MEDYIIPDALLTEILGYVKTYNRITDTTQDNLIELYIRMLYNNILVYIRRSEFPLQLKYVLVDLVNDRFFSNTPDSSLKSIQSMSEYDRSVSFGTSDELKARLDILAKQQVQDNVHLLNEFRLLYKT